MQSTLIRSLVLGFATVSMSAAVNAASIGVDFYATDSSGQTPASTDVVGPQATSGWYNLFDLNSPPTYHAADNPYNASDHGTPVALKDTTNTVTTATLGFNSGFPTLNGGQTYSPAYGARGTMDTSLSANQQLYNGTANANDASHRQELTLSHVPYAHYDVYLLVAAVSGVPDAPNESKASVQMFNGNTTSATAGTTYYLESNSNSSIPASGFSYVQATSTNSASPTIGANYVLFSGLEGGAGGANENVTFDISRIDTSPYSAGAFLGGLQIVEVVPEPSSLGLLALLAPAMLKRRRRKVAAA